MVVGSQHDSIESRIAEIARAPVLGIELTLAALQGDTQALRDAGEIAGRRLDEALSWGYDADKLKRLGEVEAALAAADCALPEPELTPEEVAKADWMRRTYDY